MKFRWSFFRLQFGKPWRKVLIISTLSLPKSIPLVDAAFHHTLRGCLTVRLIRRSMTSVLQCNSDIHCGRGWPLYVIYLKCLLCFYLLETAYRSCFSGAVPPKLQKHEWNVQHGEPFVHFAMEYVWAWVDFFCCFVLSFPSLLLHHFKCTSHRALTV